MNKQEQIEKMAKVISNSCDREGIAKRCPERIAFALAEAGYVNGADFVEWLKNKYKAEYDRWKGVAISIRIDDIEELLQEYLKGE